ncbi:MAG: hypothetical protein ACJ786_10595 [Catenulispora sp.]
MEALAEQVEAVVLVGAQAVYLRTQDADLSTQAYTADGDLALDPNALADEPRLEQAMRSAGFFQQPAGSGQPGQWYRTEKIGVLTRDIPVDLLVPEIFAGEKGRRSAGIPPHDRMAARKVAGLELALFDSDVMYVSSLEPAADPRHLEFKVAGITALLVAKAYKLGERLEASGKSRVIAKDAGDVYRLMIGSNVEDVAATFDRLRQSEEIAEIVRTGLARLHTQFGRPRAPGVVLAQQALSGAVPPERVTAIATTYVGQLPDS